MAQPVDCRGLAKLARRSGPGVYDLDTAVPEIADISRRYRYPLRLGYGRDQTVEPRQTPPLAFPRDDEIGKDSRCGSIEVEYPVREPNRRQAAEG